MNRKNAQPYELMASTPCDIFFVSCPSDFVLKLPKDPSCESFALNYPDCGFRGVSIDSLPAVLQQGIDVVPTNDVIFVDDLDKALEYGGWPKVLLALRWSSLKCTFKHLPADSSKEKVEKVRHEFPNMVKLDDRSLWCTRLKEDDQRIATDYEIAYGKWIPGDPWAALKAIFLLGRPQDQATFKRLLHKA